MPRPLRGQRPHAYHLSSRTAQKLGTLHNALFARCIPLPRSPSSLGSSHAKSQWGAIHRLVLVRHGRLMLCPKYVPTLEQHWCRPQQHLHRMQRSTQHVRCRDPHQEVRGARLRCSALHHQNDSPSFAPQVANFYSVWGSPSPAIPPTCRLTMQQHKRVAWEREKRIYQSVAIREARVFVEASLQTPTLAMGLVFHAMACCAVEEAPTATEVQERCLCVPSSIDIVWASALWGVCALPHHHATTEVAHFLAILVKAFSFYRHNATIIF